MYAKGEWVKNSHGIRRGWIEASGPQIIYMYQRGIFFFVFIFSPVYQTLFACQMYVTRFIKIIIHLHFLANSFLVVLSNGRLPIKHLLSSANVCQYARDLFALCNCTNKALCVCVCCTNVTICFCGFTFRKSLFV